MSLWNHKDFLKLWTGQTVSEIGSRITRDGIPLAAVLLLGASPMTMSLIRLAAFLPVSLVGLFVGVWVDRLQRRPLMIFADVSRAVLLATIPVSAFFHNLHIWLLIVVSAVTGLLTLLFDVSYQAYVPWLVDRDHVQEGNTKLGITSSAAEVIGPGLTGFLVQGLTAPIAILFDAVSYIVSAVSVMTIRAKEPLFRLGRTTRQEMSQDLLAVAASKASEALADGVGLEDSEVRADGRTEDWRREVREGIQVIRTSPHLRALAGAAVTVGFASSLMGVLYTLYAIKTLGLTPWLFGVTVTMGGIGSLIGASLSGSLVKRFGYGRIIVLMLFLYGLCSLFIPFAEGPLWRSVVFLMAAQLFGDWAGVIYEILDMTLRQHVASDDVLGRLNATIRVLEVALTAVGALLAGWLGELVGLRLTMGLAATGMILSTFWLVFSPIRRMKELPDDAAQKS
ncbi:MFS transporter [Alicyclobacillus ferrooxydans]|uniref:Major facilitator superfamily (MFS) profile domain-containing protein n=1 Tax=Alicyclobacillus ferrooxydans TaxID=471514 RepID=A0A0P9CYX6_9BACL|nr:MFS transporter [Alicyclobacillus ferrooxydans]KPV42178.1 hypothetical protein AN477_19265 [Alicyclobacillus ferrooxydans]